MSREAHIIGEVVDIYGTWWDVRERRPTSHGWFLHIGWPRGEPRGRGGRGVAAILTPLLAEYLTDTRPRDYQLPIGTTTARRLRRELNLRWSWDAWWEARSDDLMSMTLERFADLHGCSIGAASQRRARLREALDNPGYENSK